MNRRHSPRLLAAALLAFCVCCIGRPAHAESIIRHPGLHPIYSFEAEPHALFDPFFDPEPGIGFRGTVVIVDNGFVKSINNSVGIGFGADWTKSAIRVPVVMQWNFFLSRDWSVFGEPGFVVRTGRRGHFYPSMYVGGRYHFNDTIALTLRAGFPSFSVGVSFLL
jgi:hypothetical protein